MSLTTPPISTFHRRLHHLFRQSKAQTSTKFPWRCEKNWLRKFSDRKENYYVNLIYLISVMKSQFIFRLWFIYSSIWIRRTWNTRHWCVGGFYMPACIRNCLGTSCWTLLTRIIRNFRHKSRNLLTPIVSFQPSLSIRAISMSHRKVFGSIMVRKFVARKSLLGR